MKAFGLLIGIVVSLLSVFPASAQQASPIYVDQGPQWTAASRADFYTRDQGSQMIPLAWLQALLQMNGQPFLADSLARYGYLPDPGNAPLPIGFTASGPEGAQIVGMTCSACHTRQITADGNVYRIDGGPAIVDFQGLLTDLDESMGRALATNAAFNTFAGKVLGAAAPDSQDVAALRSQVDAWYLRFHTIITRALPASAWGWDRLDAVGMIFDRLIGLDLGPPPSLLLPNNIKKADAPVRYPFIWNAPIQDKTQWPGFADNGSDVLALARNLGEVIGVFGVMQPKREGLFINFNNAANFDGLSRLENLVKQIGPPKWPWPVDPGLVAQGAAIFARSTENGGCHECHAVTAGAVRVPPRPTWATPIKNVNTDTREYDVLSWTGQTGSLQGGFVPFVTSPLKQTDTAFNVLATAVIGSIIEHAAKTTFGAPPSSTAVASTEKADVHTASATQHLALRPLPPEFKDLQGAFHLPATAEAPQVKLHVQGLEVPKPPILGAAPPEKGAYEARVMQGIWAAAPYLHNGSVPSMVELLKPAAERVKQFKVGNAYDPETVGLAVDQPTSNYVLVTTDCSELNSGNSRCGHEYGTKLSDQEKKALLEYLKTL